MVLVQKQTCNQWNKIKSPHKCTHNFSHLMFDEDAKNILQRKGSVFNNWFWEDWMSTCRRMKLDLHLSPCTKPNSKWIKELNMKP